MSEKSPSLKKQIVPHKILSCPPLKPPPPHQTPITNEWSNLDFLGSHGVILDCTFWLAFTCENVPVFFLYKQREKTWHTCMKSNPIPHSSLSLSATPNDVKRNLAVQHRVFICRRSKSNNVEEGVAGGWVEGRGGVGREALDLCVKTFLPNGQLVKVCWILTYLKNWHQIRYLCYCNNIMIYIWKQGF